jgi:hypothetical protein
MISIFGGIGSTIKERSKPPRRRDATIEAAKLRAVAAVGSAVGHNIARDMEQGLTLRC